MYEKKLERDVRCPMERGFEIIAGKWKIRIIGILAGCGALRNGEIKKRLINISDAVLAQTLKELTRDEIISRKQYDELPLRVEYTLTQKGSELFGILQDLCNWAGRYYWDDSENLMPQCERCEYLFKNDTFD